MRNKKKQLGNNKISETSGLEPVQDELQDDVQNDEIIGKAFRWSLTLFSVLAVSGALIWSMNKEEAEELLAVSDKGLDVPLKIESIASVSPPQVSFVDVATAAGIDFRHFSGAYGEKLLPETMGGGVAFLDYDNDGDADLLLVNGTSWPEESLDNTPVSSLTLYDNDGLGNFTDVTDKTGLIVKLYGMGVAVGDYDGDKDVDIFVTAVGENRLLQNDNGHFVDVTESSGTKGGVDEWSTSAAFFDADNDGDLDLFVANYVQWSRDIDLEVDYRLTGIGRAYGPPTNFEGQYSRFYLNNGDGTFSEHSAESGIQVNNSATGKPVGKSLAVIPVDIDNDHLMDLVVANDTVQNFVFHNKGNGKFEEVGALWGMAFDRNGHATGAMGIDAAWYRNDLSLGFVIGNFANEMSSFYVANDASTYFSDQSIVDGIGPASRSRLSFGLFFFDYDLDGRLDLFQANGHVENEINKVQKSQSYKQPSQLFWNCGEQCDVTFVEHKPNANNGLSKNIVGRGAAYADIDGDGDLDILVTQIEGVPLLLRNDQKLSNHWLHVKLSQTGGNSNAIGALVKVKLHNGEEMQQLVMPTRSYLSQVLPQAYFGLGKNTEVEQIIVTWPDGLVQAVTNIGKVDRVISIQRNNNQIVKK
ncbi:CRTAC1 family protein [Aliikangiella sp. G2MR2-5]|uniref:CRTAC1 family protein n=1 Tax=Aliikangiella sp. G2MR2-5 TaxID=2788943 RepID=UPI0018AAED99|nr:CRTAC1 family protein [Aliikangiella sp. G2MR2-5]